MIHDTTINDVEIAQLSTGSSKNKSLPNNQENHSLNLLIFRIVGHKYIIN